MARVAAAGLFTLSLLPAVGGSVAFAEHRDSAYDDRDYDDRGYERGYYDDDRPHHRNSYNSDYIFATTRGLNDMDAPEGLKITLIPVTLVLDIAFLPFATIAGLFG
jgi:hypothetical protein